ncbi:MAG TPA: phosphate/phosphite/phosphonate ABC transporter substrate-binding protein, partial [Coleofasciculaceae cyanobacterium]
TNLPVKVTIAQDWDSISKALSSGTLDVAWLRAWDYVIANRNNASIQAIATVNYKKRPVHYAVLITRANAPFNTLDEAIAQSKSGKKLKLSLTDSNSAPGWLIPQAEFKRRNLEAKEIFDYSEGAREDNQAIAVITGQVDIASDYDRNLDALTSAKKLDTSKIKIIWQSVPLPNDAIVIRGSLPDDIKTTLKQALINFTPEQSQQFLPKNYTGFTASNGSNYASIQAAGALMGKLK